MSRNQPPSLMKYQVGGTPAVLLVGLAIVGIVIGIIAAGIGIRLTARSTDQSEFTAQYITTVAALYDVEHSDPAQAGQAVANAKQRLLAISPDHTTLPLDTIGSVAGQYQAFRPNTQDAKNVVALANALNAPISAVAVPAPTPAGPGPSSVTFIIILALITVVVGIIWFVMLQRSQTVSAEEGEEAAGLTGFAGRMASRLRRVRIPSGAPSAAPVSHQYTQPRQLQSPRRPSSPQPAAPGYEQPAYQQAPARPRVAAEPPRQPQANGAGTLPEYEPAAEEPVAQPANAGNTQRSAVRPMPRPEAGQPVNRTFHFDYRFGDEPYQAPFTIEGNQRGVMIASAGVDPGLRLSENPDRYCSFLVWLFDDSNEEGSSVAILSAWVDSQNMPEIDNWLQQSGPQTTVVANRGTLARLETSTVVLEVICSGFGYGNEGNFPPRSFFSQLSLDLRVTVQG